MLTVCEGGHDAIGAVVFVQVKLTVTAELFQPAEFGSGETEAVIVGDVVAIFNEVCAVAVFPAKSVAVPATT